MDTANVNLNQASCIQTADYFTHTHYVNVCSGATYDVPYGTADYLVGFFIGLMFVGFAWFIYKFIKAMTAPF